jgi:RNA polymerase sigma factor (sigma-70 family)
MKAVSSPTAAAPNDSASASSRKAWRERSARLYAEFEPGARALVRRAFRGAFGEDELDDIYSNAWLGTLRALERRHTTLADDEIRSYVFAAVAHQAGREIRRRKRKPTAPLDAALGRADAGPTPDERVASAESSRVTRDLLASLPPRRRSVMLLRYGWGLDPQQVCRLVDGLSPRAYRKEITRGVDELTEKVRSFERGDWCADREPVLKAYAAGLADGDQARQAEAHLSHCRSCNDFLARLNGHLHDLGGAALAPSAIDGLSGGGSWTERLGEIADRAREGLAGVLGRSPSGGSEEMAAAVASSGGARGAGVAGAGVLAKVAGAGAAGKVAIACIGGGVAASACIAAGVGPLKLESDSPDRGGEQTQNAAVPDAESESAPPVPATLPSQVTDSTPASAGDEAAAVEGSKDAEQREASNDREESEITPVATETPPETQEFGVEAGAVPSAPAPAGSDGTSAGGGDLSTSGSSAVKQEFGP